MITIGEFVKYNQPYIYRILVRIFSLYVMAAEVDYEEMALEEDETPEFKYYKRLMEERKGVAL